MPRNAGCQRCPLYKDVKTTCVWGSGNPNADIMLVGEAPGRDEDTLGRPFIGASGRMLDDMLVKAGLKRDQVYITNTVKCRPHKGDSDVPPTKEQQDACFMYLQDELNTVKPKVIIGLGASALKQLTGKSALRQSRGHILDPAPKVRTPAKVVATWHPAYALYQRGLAGGIKSDIIADLSMAARLTHNTQAASSSLPAHQKVMVPPGSSAQQLAAALRPLMNVQELAVDLEWTVPQQGKEVAWPWTPGHHLLSLSFSGYLGNTVYSCAIAWYPTDQLWYEALVYFMTGKRLIYHYNIGDRLWLRSKGLPCDDIADDTQHLGFLDNEQQVLKLDVLASLYAGMPVGYKIEKTWHTWLTTWEQWFELLDYNADDTYATLILRTALHTRLGSKPEPERSHLAALYYNVMLPLTGKLVKMIEHGVPMNKDLVKANIAKFEQELSVIIDRLAENMVTSREDAEAIAGSDAQILGYLRERYQLILPNTQKETFAPLFDQYPILKDIKDFQHIRNKILNTCLRAYAIMMDRQGDSVVHTMFNIITRNGRAAGSSELGSSLHQMPHEPWFREMVQAPDGYVILASDQSQVELRFIAIVSEDPVMRSYYNDSYKADLHYLTGAWIIAVTNYPDMPIEWFLDHRDEWTALVTPSQRHYVKPVNFGLAYMQEPEGLQAYASANYGVAMTIEAARAAYNGYHKLYPGIKAWHRTAVANWRRRGYVRTIFNQYRRNCRKETEVVNCEIQGPAGIMTHIVQIETDDQLSREFHPDDVWPVGQVHDNVLAVVRDNQTLIDQVTEITRYHFEHPATERLGIPRDSLPVPFRADIKVGKFWVQ